MCIQLAEKIRKNGFAPDVIVGVARGGWIPARIMSDLLDNSNLASLKVEFYVDVAKTGRKPVITQPVSTSVKGKKVLVVDDVADTGESLKLVSEHLKRRGAAEVKIATLHYKPKSILKPDFYIKETEAWIVYPHERFEFIKSMIKKFRGEGKSSDQVKEELVKIGLQAQLVSKFVDEIWKAEQA
jgi:hypoxanthine phosphoribosyltransferase